MLRYAEVIEKINDPRSLVRTVKVSPGPYTGDMKVKSSLDIVAGMYSITAVASAQQVAPPAAVVRVALLDSHLASMHHLFHARLDFHPSCTLWVSRRLHVFGSKGTGSP